MSDIIDQESGQKLAQRYKDMGDGTYALVMAADTTPIGPTTGAETNVTSVNTDTTILAANSARKGATVYNDSTAVLYLLLANATSSTTNYTVQLAAGGYYEVPFNYTGVLKGVWASANGAARVTELS